MKAACSVEIAEVRWNRTTILEQVDNPARVNYQPGSWHWDKTYLWVRPPEDTSFFRRQTTRIALGDWFWWRNPSSYSIFAGAVQAMAALYFSTVEKVLDNRHYEPRVLGAPNLSQRIEPRFGGIGQIGGGTLTLANVDGFFDDKQDWQWDAGTVQMRIGVDVPGGTPMAFSDYQVMATWTPESWRRTEREFILKLIENKNRLKTKLPFTFYDRATYPNIDDTWVGRPIGIAYGKCYGLEAVPIDVGAKRFKIVWHAIREFSAVRLRNDREQLNTRTVTDWQLYSGTVYRSYLAGEEVRNVKFNTTSLTKVNAVSDCLATAGSWATENNYTYVNPQGGQTINSGTYSVESVLVVEAWQPSNFASVDPVNGEFTLGADWIVGTEVSVDIIGKRDSGGNYIGNGVDVILDILETVGETNLNGPSFTEARSRLKAGTDESGSDVFIRAVGVFIEDQTQAVDLISEIMRAINGYLYTDANGLIAIGIFEPLPGDSLPELDKTDVLEFEESTDQLEATRAVIHYNRREKDGWEQLYTLDSPSLAAVHNQPQPVVFDDQKNLLTELDDVQSFAQRFLVLDAQPLKLFKIAVAWRGFLWKPGDQFRLNLAPQGVDQIVELIEIMIDLAAKRCQLILGNLRGYGDQPGFWVDDAAVLPARFSTLAGYGSGSLTWNKNWHADIKAWARQNVGYWTDENGFADPTDPDSKATSIWI